MSPWTPNAREAADPTRSGGLNRRQRFQLTVYHAEFAAAQHRAARSQVQCLRASSFDESGCNCCLIRDSGPSADLPKRSTQALREARKYIFSCYNAL
jgi:hypothetical protein